MIKIQCGAGLGFGASVTTSDGRPIAGVRELQVRIATDDIVTATVDVVVGAVDVFAHPLLSLESLEAAADHYGLKLVAKG